MNYFWYFASFILSICGCALITLLIMILWCRYPLAKLPCFGPFLAALNIVSKIRVTSYKVTKPTPRPRQCEPEPEPIELEELHPVIRHVQWLAGEYITYSDPAEDIPIYDVPRTQNEIMFQSILEINSSIAQMQTIEENLEDIYESIQVTRNLHIKSVDDVEEDRN